MAHERIFFVDAWISCLMVFVIMGHCFFPFAPEWYARFHSWIYSFHMGAFYLVAGFLVSLVYRPIHNVREYWEYEKRKLLKFGVPFVALGVVLTAVSVIMRKEGMKDFFDALYLLFVCPTSSRIIYLWFIYVLFMFYLVAPLFCQVLKGYAFPALVIGLAVHFLPLPHYGALHLFARFLFFFIAGTTIQDFLPVLRKIPQAMIRAGALLFIGWSCLGKPELPYLVSCCLALPCLYLFSSFLARHAGKRIVKCCTEISSHCFSIYLYQMIFLNCLALVWRRLPANSLTFIAFIFVGILISFIGSLCVAKLLDAGRNTWQSRRAA